MGWLGEYAVPLARRSCCHRSFRIGSSYRQSLLIFVECCGCIWWCKQITANCRDIFWNNLRKKWYMLGVLQWVFIASASLGHIFCLDPRNMCITRVFWLPSHTDTSASSLRSLLGFCCFQDTCKFLRVPICLVDFCETWTGIFSPYTTFLGSVTCTQLSLKEICKLIISHIFPLSNSS